MHSVMEQLYFGNIRRDSKKYEQDSLFMESVRFRSANLEQLMASINDSEKELFEKYCDAQEDIEDITRYDTFTFALKFGILLMAEVFMGREEITGEQ